MRSIQRAPRRGRSPMSEGLVLLVGLVAATAHARSSKARPDDELAKNVLPDELPDHELLGPVPPAPVNAVSTRPAIADTAFAVRVRARLRRARVRWSGGRRAHPVVGTLTALLVASVVMTGVGVIVQRLPHGQAANVVAFGMPNGAVNRSARLDIIDDIWSDAPVVPAQPLVAPKANDRVRAVARSLARTSRAARVEGGAVWPVNGPITGPFGERRGNHRHPGIDISAPTGTPAHAAVAGRVVFAGNASSLYSGYGLLVVIEHSNGDQTLYAHLSRVIAVRGNDISAGDVVGLVGATGHATGPHLHFEVRRGNAVVDPTAWVAAMRSPS